MDSVWSPSPQTDISDEKPTLKRTVVSRLRMSRRSAVTIVVVRREGADNIAVANIIPPTPLARKRDVSKTSFEILVPANKRYEKAVDYRSYHLIQKSQRYENDVPSKIQKMRKKVAVQMESQSINSKDFISVINFVTEVKQAYDFHVFTKVPLSASLENL